MDNSSYPRFHRGVVSPDSVGECAWGTRMESTSAAGRSSGCATDVLDAAFLAVPQLSRANDGRHQMTW